MKKTYIVYRITEQMEDTILIWYNEFDSYKIAYAYICKKLHSPTNLVFTIAEKFSHP